MSTCSIVIVTRQGSNAPFITVKSALMQKQLADIIIVNNGSMPEMVARLQQMALGEPRLKVITGHGDAGFSKGCNLGVQSASGDFILLLDPEYLLPPNALADLMKAFSDTSDAMLAGCRILQADGSTENPEHLRWLTPRAALSAALGMDTLRRTPVPPEPQETQEVRALASTCLCMRRADYQRLLGLDERFSRYAAGLDLALRVRKAGGLVIAVPGVEVTHLPSIDTGESAWRMAVDFRRYFAKHFRRATMPGFLLVLHAAMLLRFSTRALMRRLRRRFLAEPVFTLPPAGKRLMILASGLAELPLTREMHGKTVLVTGATSQTGLSVVRRLLAAEASVLAISRADPVPFRHERLRWIKGDLTDVNLHLDGYLADILVHCAPLWHLPGTLQMLANAEIQRIIAFGSTAIFARGLSKNEHERQMVSELAQAEKDIAERCTALGMQWTLLRPTLTYGVGLDLNVTSLAKIVRRWGFFPVYPPAFGRRQPVHADDLGMAVLQVADNENTFGKAYNVSGGDILTYRDMLARVFKLCRRKPRIIETSLLPFILDAAGWIARKPHINGEIARRMNDDLIFFHDDAARDFHFSPRPFLSGGFRDIEGF